MDEARRPIVGVAPLVDERRDSYWMLPGYFEGILEAGGVPVMLPLADDAGVFARAIAACDGLLFTGGHDVAPEVYGGLPPEAAALVGETCPARDRMETALFGAAIEQNLPVLGICRGIQVINAALGARYGRICRRSARATSSIAGMRPMTCRCIRWRSWRERPWPRSSARGSTR